MKSFIPCRACLNKSDIPGYISIPSSSGIGIKLKECACHKRWRTQQELVVSLANSNLWNDEEALQYSIKKDYIGEKSLQNLKKILYYVDNFSIEPKIKESNLYIWGPRGTQKTHIGQWIGKELLKKGVSVYYTRMQDLVKFISDITLNNKDRSELDVYSATDVLILDESFDKEKVTLYRSGFQIPFIENYLKDRIENEKKAVIFISNIAVNEIASQGFSKSIQDFIYRNTEVKKTSLFFNDVYYDIINTIDVESIFPDEL